MSRSKILMIKAVLLCIAAILLAPATWFLFGFQSNRQQDREVLIFIFIAIYYHALVFLYYLAKAEFSKSKFTLTANYAFMAVLTVLGSSTLSMVLSWIVFGFWMSVFYFCNDCKETSAVAFLTYGLILTYLVVSIFYFPIGIRIYVYIGLLWLLLFYLLRLFLNEEILSHIIVFSFPAIFTMLTIVSIIKATRGKLQEINSLVSK